MPDAELFIHLAEIAGVFVGFGALIAVRSSDTDTHTFEYLRGLVGGGLWVILVAIAPIAVGFFGVEGYALWAPCSALALLTFIAFWVVDARSPENRAERLNRAATVRYAAVAIPMTLGIFTALVLILVGALPEVAPGLYFAAVAIGLLEEGWDLVTLVWTQARSPL